jgi:predicted PhzF superfamily epimerase YddE/YHI9
VSGQLFFHVDAFAEAPFTGNPAAVILLDVWPDDAVLQRIAAEMNLPATAFCVRVAGEADFAIRWFSPRAKIGLCGHGTLAAGHALIGDKAVIRFATARADIVSVTHEDGLYHLSLPALVAAPHALPESVAALGGDPVETLWHARGYALVRYADAAAIRALTPDFGALAALGDIQHAVTAPGDDTDIVSRVFTRRSEDAVTGSAHAMLTPYWAERLGRPELSAFQASARGGRLSCRMDGDRVVLGGRCVTVAEGRFRL